jgi:hypothetical protein
MTEIESYVTKASPSVEDWLEYNKDLFAALKGSTRGSIPQYAPFVDVDRHAAEAEVSTKEYYEQVKEMVGPLGRAALILVHSDMDDAWHIIVGVTENNQD